MSKHTPGPWRVGGVNGNVVYGTEPEIGSLVVAHCNHTGEVPPEVDEANAHLIARSPQLLNVLRDLRDASVEAYKAGRIDALAFVTANNLIAEIDGK